MTCFNSHTFPFTAIVGQEKMKLALILNAIDPRIGGVLIRGEKGTAKSTVARALADLLPEIEVVESCRFGCDPRVADRLCVECLERLARGGELKAVRRKMKVVNLPINATQDRVAGTLDLEQAIKKGEKRFEPGILALTNRGILYVDEVNLLGDHIVDILLDSAAMGVNVVEREGVSFSHPSHFILVGTMNPEEGELRPQLLDRFALCVDVEGIREPGQRKDVTRRRLEYERDPHAFCDKWAPEQRSLAGRIVEAVKLLPGVSVPDEMLDLITRISLDLGVDGHRADIVMMKASAAIAAFNGRSEVGESDVKEAAAMVYPHRMRRKPFEETGSSEKIEESVERQSKPQEQELKNEGQLPPEQNEHMTVSPIGAPADLKFEVPKGGRVRRDGGGRRSTTPTGESSGVYVRSDDMKPRETDVAFDASLRAAAPYQASRDKGGMAVALKPHDMKKKVREKKVGSTVLFVVDASGSMGAQQRMEATKGAILTLLIDAYQRRDKVGMVAFRDEGAELLLKPTSSVELAKKCLEELPMGGRTPLAHGLLKGLVTLKNESMADHGMLPVVVLVTDGKANVPLNDGKPVDEALEVAGKLAQERYTVMVLDTENDFINLGLAQKVAEASGAQYFKLDDVSAGRITGLVKGVL